jgi:hypothetical protein
MHFFWSWRSSICTQMSFIPSEMLHTCTQPSVLNVQDLGYIYDLQCCLPIMQSCKQVLMLLRNILRPSSETKWVRWGISCTVWAGWKEFRHWELLGRDVANSSLYTPQPWRWRQHVPQKHHYLPTGLHYVATQKIIIWRSTAVKTSVYPQKWFCGLAKRYAIA